MKNTNENSGPKRILLTGMSAVGKSSIIEEIRKHGYVAIDTDYNGWITSREDGERNWVEEKMNSLLNSEEIKKGLVVSGTVINQGKFYNKFDKIVLLTAPIEVISKRLQSRSKNPFGKDHHELEKILNDKKTFEPILRKSADMELDTDRPFSEVIEIILKLLNQ